MCYHAKIESLVLDLDKTVPSYRMASENEIESWNNFAEALDTQDGETFERLMDA